MWEFRRILVEVLLILALGSAIGLTANAFHRNGINLNTNYFASLKATPAPIPSPSPNPNASGTTDPIETDRWPDVPDELRSVFIRLDDLGYQPITFAQARAIAESPFARDGVYLIIDARDEEKFGAGHIPHAWLLDHFHKDRYLAELQPMLDVAEKIMVYCNGGHCDDSELVAADLLELGIDPMRMFIYAGGMSQWRDKGMPVETGSRGSGRITESSSDSSGADISEPLDGRGGTP